MAPKVVVNSAARRKVKTSLFLSDIRCKRRQAIDEHVSGACVRQAKQNSKMAGSADFSGK